MPFFAVSTVPHAEGGSTRSIARRLTHSSTASVSGFSPTSDPRAGSRHKMLNRSTVASAPPACTTASSSVSVIGEPSLPSCPWTGWPEGVGSGSWSPPDFIWTSTDDCSCWARLLDNVVSVVMLRYRSVTPVAVFCTVRFHCFVLSATP